MTNKFVIRCAALAALLISPAIADDAVNTSVEVAEAYLAAYSTFETANIEPFLADEMVFMDPTSEDESADGGPFMFDGKEAVLKGLGDYAAQYSSFTLSYDVKKRYESEGVVVFIADLTWSLVTADDKSMTAGAPIVTAVTVKDGKVVNHLDLYDYKGNAVTFGAE